MTHPCMLFLYATYDCSRRFMKRLVLHALRSSGVFALTRALSAKMARILMYHNFSGPGATDADALNVEGIRRQFTYLRRHFRVVPLLQIAEQLASGRELTPRMAALTIDDGRRNCYEFLFPLLQEFEFPATFFVVNSFIQGEDWIWTDKVIWLSEQPNPPAELIPGKLEAVFEALNRLRPEARNAQIETLAKRAGVTIPRPAPAKYASCSWSELREMADSGLVEIGSHTVTHPILSTLTDEESWYELSESRRQIEEALSKTVRCFCFPNGKSGDYRPRQVHQIADAGYLCSVVAESGLVGSGADRYQLPRIGGRSEILFRQRVDGAEYYQHTLRSCLGASEG